MDKRYALMRDGLVENVVLWDGQTEWTPPEGHTLIELASIDAASPGDTYDAKGGGFAAKTLDAPPVETINLESLVALLKEKQIITDNDTEAMVAGIKTDAVAR